MGRRRSAWRGWLLFVVIWFAVFAPITAVGWVGRVDGSLPHPVAASGAAIPTPSFGLFSAVYWDRGLQILLALTLGVPLLVGAIRLGIGWARPRFRSEP